MSRSCYSDEFGDEFPGQLELYRANVERSMRSRAGQQRLIEMRDALLTMTVKELVSDSFVSDTGACCGLGSWAIAKCDGDVTAAKGMVPTDGDDHDTFEALSKHGWPKLVVFEMIYENDESSRWRSKNFTPAMRYDHVLHMLNRWIVTTDALQSTPERSDIHG